MSIIQDKIGNEFLRSTGGMDSNFPTGMIMFSHLPPVTSFTRLAAQSVMHDLPGPQDVILKKERESPGCGVAGLGGYGAVADYVHSMGIKQEKSTEHDYRLPLYPGGPGKTTDLLEGSMGSQQNLLVHDLSLGNLPSRLGKESSGKKGRRSNGDGQEEKPRKKRGEPKSMMLDAEGDSLSPNGKPHICEHCSASFRSSYHLRRHVLIHTGERPFRCSQCNMSFIQKYLLQRHEKIHSGEKPFCCDQCNMRFIQKYHMERHKRTHSGEKPYRCETCQQFFSRTDRLLKHKRTCGEAMKKGLEPGMLDLDGEDMGPGSYGIAQGNAGASARKRGKSKHPAEGGERKRKKGTEPAEGLGVASVHEGQLEVFDLHDYSSESHALSSSAQPGTSMHHSRAPKMAFKKANRKALEKGVLGPTKQDTTVQSGVGGGMDGVGLMQGFVAKSGPTSSNYDDAMQFLKKRRYLHAAHSAASGPGLTGSVSGDYEINVGHLSSQQSVIQGVVSGVMDSDTPLSLLDSSPMGGDKQEKASISDEVLQSLLDHYSQKSDSSHHDVHFDIGDQHLELHPTSADSSDLGHDADSPSPPGDKAVLMHEYSRFLLQALERTSHSAGFPLGPGLPASGPFTSAHQGNLLFSDKLVYTTSPLECAFSQPGASPSLPSSVPKSHFAMLSGSSPQHSFHLSGLEPASSQQLTPSQELTDQMEKPHSSSSSSSPPSSSSYQISPSDLASRKDSQQSKSARTSYPQATLQALSSLGPSKTTYTIENFAQAFGSQFKSAGHGPLSYGPDSSGEVDHGIRTPISEFSGYSSLLADVNEPVSTGSKTPTSQSYR